MTAMLNRSSSGLGVLARAVAERHELVEGDAALRGPAAEVGLDEGAGEAVDAGGDRGVGGEDRGGSGGLDGLVEGQAVVDDRPAHALEAEEAGVALVGVEHLGVDAERLEGPDAADAEEDLLAEAVLDVAAVEPVGDPAQVIGVLVDVGVEQVERDAPDVGPPHLGAAAACRPRSTVTRMPSHSVSDMAQGSWSGKRSCCQPSGDSPWRK